MKIKAFVSALLICIALPVSANMTPVTESYEVGLDEVRMPRLVGGTIAFKACAECSYRRDVVSERTVWLINNKPVSLREFRSRTDKVADRDNHTVTVQRNLKTNEIVEVSIVIRD